MALATNTNDIFSRQLFALERATPSARRRRGRALEFWRTSDPEMDDRLRITMGGLFTAQREWWNLTTFVKALVAGYGAGKSMALCKRAIASALHNSGCVVALVSPTFSMARRTIIRSLLELLEGKRRLLGDAFWYKYNQSIHEVTIRYRGRTGIILILSGEDPVALKGSNLAAAYLDEPFIMDEEVFNQIAFRVRHPEAKLEEICLSGTPENLNWGYKLCRGQRLDIEETLDSPLTVGVVNGSTRGNLALKPEYVKRLMARLSPTAAKAYIEGKFVNLTEGRVFYGFDEDVHVKSGPIPDHAEIGVGMDFNVNPMSATVFWKLRDHIHFFEEILIENSDTEEMAQTLRSKPYSNRISDVYPDPSGRDRHTNAPQGRTDFHILEEYGFDVNTVTGFYGMKDSLNIVNGKFKPAEGTPSISIEPRCTRLIDYLNTYSHKIKNEQEEMKHLLDAFRYPLAYLFPLPTDRVRELAVHGA